MSARPAPDPHSPPVRRAGPRAGEASRWAQRLAQCSAPLPWRRHERSDRAPSIPASSAEAGQKPAPTPALPWPAGHEAHPEGRRARCAAPGQRLGPPPPRPVAADRRPRVPSPAGCGIAPPPAPPLPPRNFAICASGPRFAASAPPPVQPGSRTEAPARQDRASPPQSWLPSALGLARGKPHLPSRPHGSPDGACAGAEPGQRPQSQARQGAPPDPAPSPPRRARVPDGPGAPQLCQAGKVFARQFRHPAYPVTARRSTSDQPGSFATGQAPPWPWLHPRQAAWPAPARRQ